MDKFTKTFVQNLEFVKDGDTNKKGQKINQKLYWDSQLKGFSLRVSFSNKAFIVQGRVNGKDRRVKIGDFGVWTVDDARKKAKSYLNDMAQGVDPSLEKKQKKVKSKSLEDVVKDYKGDRELKPLTVRDIDTHLNTTFKDWKSQPIAQITRDKVLKLFRKKSESSPSQANQAFRIP